MNVEINDTKLTLAWPLIIEEHGERMELGGWHGVLVGVLLVPVLLGMLIVGAAAMFLGAVAMAVAAVITMLGLPALTAARWLAGR